MVTHLNDYGTNCEHGILYDQNLFSMKIIDLVSDKMISDVLDVSYLDVR